MRNKLKSVKGFTVVDLTISLIVIVMFVTIMTTVSYNIYLSTVEAKRTGTALNYAVDIFEHIGALDFEEVVASYELFDIDGMEGFTYDDIEYSGNSSTITGSIDSYDITLTIEDYKGDNVVKIITLKIEYKVSKDNTESMELQRLKTIDG